MSQRLIEALAADGDELRDAAAAIGGKVAFEPHAALERDGIVQPQEPSQQSPNGYCRLIKTKDGWIAVNLAREDDRQTVPAWAGCPPQTDCWHAMTTAAGTQNADQIVTDGVELHLPVARIGETPPLPPHLTIGKAGIRRMGRPAALDMSALWAGPYCGALLAEAGVDVTRMESTTRPDPTGQNSPMLDSRLNGKKRRIWLSPIDPMLIKLIAKSDILITSARQHSLARLGLSEAALFAINPNLIWIAITAHGWSGDAGMRVGFGDDCAAAGGLVTWRDGRPAFMGDALADPLTGLAAATQALKMLSQGKAGLIDIALARVAARMAERLELR